MASHLVQAKWFEVGNYFVPKSEPFISCCLSLSELDYWARLELSAAGSAYLALALGS